MNYLVAPYICEAGVVHDLALHCSCEFDILAYRAAVIEECAQDLEVAGLDEAATLLRRKD